MPKRGHNPEVIRSDAVERKATNGASVAGAATSASNHAQWWSNPGRHVRQSPQCRDLAGFHRPLHKSRKHRSGSPSLSHSYMVDLSSICAGGSYGDLARCSPSLPLIPVRMSESNAKKIRKYCRTTYRNRTCNNVQEKTDEVQNNLPYNRNLLTSLL